MAAGDTPITIIGNLVDEPQLRYTPAGMAVANFRVASTPRYLDKATNEWKDGDGLFLGCNVWRQAAENAAESLAKGMRVIVNGRLRQRSYEAKDGSKRTVYEIEADDVGPSLRNASAKVTRSARSGLADGQARGPAADDPWSADAGSGYSAEPPSRPRLLPNRAADHLRLGGRADRDDFCCGSARRGIRSADPAAGR